MTPEGRAQVRAVRDALVVPKRVCEALGLIAGPGTWLRQAGRGVTVRCVWHEERTPSCSVSVAPDGAIRVHCFGCKVGGDVIALIAAVRGYSLTNGPDFREALAEGARMAGLWELVDKIEGRSVSRTTVAASRPAVSPPRLQEPERTWPPVSEVSALWGSCRSCEGDAEVAWYLDGRALDPGRVDAGDLARVLPETGALPKWAVCRGGSWREAGYRLVVPCFAPDGALRSLRAWRVVNGGVEPLPKRLPPTGHKAGGLVLADGFARAWLRGERAPASICVAEGESDWLTWACKVNDPALATIGVWSGSWGPDFAARCPLGARVDVWTDTDTAGDRYMADVAKTLGRRCFVYRRKELVA